MPLDPTLARGFDIPKIESPIDQMGGALTNALMMSKMNTSRDESLRNAMLDKVMRARMRPDGTYDQGGVLYDMAQADIGRVIPDQQKAFLEMDKTKAETAGSKATASKSMVDAQAKFNENYATLLNGVTDFEQLKSRVVQAYKNDVAFSVLGPEGAKAAANNDLMEAQAAATKSPADLAAWINNKVVGKDARKNSYQVIGDAKGQTLGATNDYGTPGFKPIKELGPKPVSQGTTINMPGAKTYAEKVTELTAENDVAAGKAAAAVPLIVADLDLLDGLIDRAFTGRGSEFKESVSAWTGTNQDSVNATQQMKQLLSTDMLKNIGTLCTQYDVKLGSVTEKEFDQLRNTTPKPSDTPATIKAWVKKAKEIALKTQADYDRLRKNREQNTITSPVSSLLPPARGAVSAPPSLPPSIPMGPVKTKKGREVPADAVSELMDPSTTPADMAEFDAVFGEPGLAKRLRGGSPNGGRPLPR
jgi:hypothetical protein